MPEMPETAAYPPVAELLPHDPPMMLVDHVLHHDEAGTVCIVDPAASSLFRNEDGSVPTWLGLEYMAQTVAAYGGLVDRAAGRPTRPGLFLGSRRLSFATDRFPGDRLLEVHARHLRGLTGLIAFDCEVRDATSAQVLVSGVLNVYLMDSFDALHAEFGG
jgi:predicted hotdog family 3-hydroxylacyl-ACP dehydratase